MARRGEIIKGTVSMCFVISRNWTRQYLSIFLWGCGTAGIGSKKIEIQMQKTMSPTLAYIGFPFLSILFLDLACVSFQERVVRLLFGPLPGERSP